MHPLKVSLLSLVLAGLSLFGSAVLAITPDGETPANEGVCDGLMGGTPGLYGLCVAFCEAQDCEATLDPATGLIEFEPGCKTSDIRLLERYNSRKEPTDPDMPCVNVAANECQCWSSEELYGLANFETLFCDESPPGWALTGRTLAPWKVEYAVATPTDCLYHGADANGEEATRYQTLDGESAGVCISTIKTECTYRGF
ncbi:MAG TPA: hypothetical protein VET88_00195 [Gammaproteobacteria bacterium]|nr:hypothetical protein [Gammaproteobacteria bacterium]